MSLTNIRDIFVKHYYDASGKRSRQIFPSPFFLSNHWLQGNVTHSCETVFVTSIFDNIHPALNPLLSCSMRTRVREPKSRASRLKLSLLPRSNKSTNFLVSGLRPVSSFEPYMVIWTLASVPAPCSSPV